MTSGSHYSACRHVDATLDDMVQNACASCTIVLCVVAIMPAVPK